MDDKDDQKKTITQLGVFITIPFVLAVPPIIGWFLGKWIDHLFDTHFIKYVFILLGAIAGFREMYRIVKRYGDDT